MALSSSDDDDNNDVIDLTATSKMKVAALKKALKAHNLNTRGRKTELRQRLERARAESGAAKVRA